MKRITPTVSKLVRRYGVALAFVLLATFSGMAIKRSAANTAEKAGRASALIVYDSQLEACDREGDLRNQLNVRNAANETMRDSILSFLKVAYDARLSSYQRDHDPADLKAANGYAKLIRNINKEVHYSRVTVVKCEEIIKRP